MKDGCHHQVESEWMSEVFLVQMVGTNLGKCEWVWEDKLKWLNPNWWNSSWQNSRWLLSSSWIRMNEWSFFCAKWLNPRWQNSIWLPSSSWVRMNEWSFFFQLGILYSILWNAKHYGRHFTVVSLPGHCYTLCHSYYWGGATPSQINSLGSIQVHHLMRGNASFIWPLLSALMLTHSQ